MTAPGERDLESHIERRPGNPNKPDSTASPNGDGDNDEWQKWEMTERTKTYSISEMTTKKRFRS
jgi:hypothetical protein